MFNCFVHGWCSRQEACPTCNPVVYSTSGSSEAVFQDNMENPRLDSLKQKIKTLEEENEKLKAELAEVKAKIERLKKLYISAVKSRRELRQALRESREETKATDLAADMQRLDYAAELDALKAKQNNARIYINEIQKLREENEKLKTQIEMLSAPDQTKYALLQFAKLDDEGKQKIIALTEALLDIKN